MAGVRAFFGLAIVAGGVAVLFSRRAVAYAVPNPASLDGFQFPAPAKVETYDWLSNFFAPSVGELSTADYFGGSDGFGGIDTSAGFDTFGALGFSPVSTGGAVPSGSGYAINNPGNIEYSASNAWLGQIGRSGRWAVFSDVKYGIRAIGKLIETYFDRYGLTSIAAIISRYAPPNENDTAAYIRNVAAWSGISGTATLRRDQLPAVVSAMLRMETGPHSFSKNYIASAMSLTGGGLTA